MSSVTLQFVQGRDLGAHLIQWFGCGPRYSHVDIVLQDGSLYGARSDRIGDIPPGVESRPASYVSGEKTLRIVIPCTPAQAHHFYDFLKDQKGKPYDKVGILAFILGRNWRDTDAWFCSELASAALEQAGILRKLASSTNKITPPNLILILSALTDVKI